MADPEIVALRAKPAQRVRAGESGQRPKDVDAIARADPTAVDVVVEPVTANGVRAEWSNTPGAAQDAAILHLHGGGYAIGSLLSHRHMVSEIGRVTQVRTLALDDRPAPEHPFPAAMDDALAWYRFLLWQGLQPGRIAIAGDGAGGGLTAAALLAIGNAGLPQPACGWCISPWVDLEGVGESMTARAAVDPTVPKDLLAELARLYFDGADPRSPLAAPIYPDLREIAPLLIEVGAAEALLDDALRRARGQSPMSPSNCRSGPR